MGSGAKLNWSIPRYKEWQDPATELQLSPLGGVTPSTTWSKITLPHLAWQWVVKRNQELSSPDNFYFDNHSPQLQQQKCWDPQPFCSLRMILINFRQGKDLYIIDLSFMLEAWRGWNATLMVEPKKDWPSASAFLCLPSGRHQGRILQTPYP